MTKKEQLKALIEKLKKMPRPALIRSIAAVCVLVFALAAGIDVTYTWLSSRYEAASFSIFTGTTDYIPVTMWTFTTQKEGASNSTGSWESRNLTGSAEGYAKFEGATKSGITYEIKSLNMGGINNLMSVSEDNIVYLRFEISRAKNGETISFDASGVGITVYDQYGNAVSDISGITDINNSETFIEMSYALDSRRAPTEDTKFTDLTYTALPSTAKNVYDLDVSAPEGSADVYFLYIRMSPKLRSYGLAAKKLYSAMPCTMFFDWDMLLEVH